MKSKFKSNVIIIIILFFNFQGHLMSSVHKTAADNTFNILRYTMSLYREKNDGRLPVNWQEFAASGVMTPQMTKDNKSNLDLEHRYRIYNPPLVVKHHSEEIKIIVMAMRAGDEGNRSSEDEDGTATEILGRNLVFEKLDGKISSGRFAEIYLVKIFSDAGLSLYNHTSDMQNLPKGANSTNLKDTSGLALGSANSRLNSDSLNQEIIEYSVNDRESGESKASPSAWQILGVTTLALFVWVIYRLIRRQQNGID